MASKSLTKYLKSREHEHLGNEKQLFTNLSNIDQFDKTLLDPSMQKSEIRAFELLPNRSFI